ncbi:DUF1680 family protein [Paenibacillus turicensis]|uniref:DUF1680 family protein n=1 Tax=Paenibacillus turicensis TaxID=160487 RepID=A0ABS4FY76_9BACL|nr:beta-L-arabinofuranosidase domain-containing protein [Paenibacillus turicensis]MBP1907536.1 DUF1680 family protein [Paenibacillus turicensis]
MLKNNSFVTLPLGTLQDFPMNQVQMTDTYISNAFDKEYRYLKNYELDRLLSAFRQTRGLAPKAANYPGWENTEIRGHTLGHYMTAIAQAYLNSHDSEFLDKINYILDDLEICQFESGYLSAFPEQLFDNVENKQPAWVPWYTMHKIIAGLGAIYKVTQHATAYKIVSQLGDWVYNRSSAWSPEVHQQVLSVEYGGMNDCLYELYKITKNENHLFAAHQFDELTLFEPISGGKDILKGKHANTTIPKFLGALNRYLVLGESEVFYLQSVIKFWDMVVHHHSYITGGNSEWEHFGEPDILDAERSNFTAETCNTYNMLKLTKELFKLTGEVKYADFYENTFMNAILSSQHPHSGMTMYFQPMATGYFKVYSSAFEHFWCCTGTGMESFTKLNDSIYFYDDKNIYVNQYISSIVESPEHGVKLEQVSALPIQDITTFRITLLPNTKSGDGDKSKSESASFALRLRLPDWLAGQAHVTVNGELYSYKIENNYAVLTHPWQNGDEICIQLPMKVTYHSLPDAPHVLGFKYGPIVLSAALGTADMSQSATGVNVSVPTKNMLVKDFITPTQATVEEWLSNFDQNFVRVSEDLVFELRGTDEDAKLQFTPHYKQHEQRYGIYWNFVGKDSAELQAHILQSKQNQTIAEATIDSLPVGNDQYELEHHVQGENTTVTVWDGYTGREAENGGWFSYRMKVLANQPNYLAVTYFSGNNGKEIEIYVDDTLIVSETLMTEQTRAFYVKRYLIPTELTSDVNEIVVRFVMPNKRNGIYDILRVMDSYSEQAQLKHLSFNTGVWSTAFDPAQHEYTLTLPSDQTEVSMLATPAHKNALLYVNNILIDDTQARTMTLTKSMTKLDILVKAENVSYTEEYKINIQFT